VNFFAKIARISGDSVLRNAKKWSYGVFHLRLGFGGQREDWKYGKIEI